MALDPNKFQDFRDTVDQFANEAAAQGVVQKYAVEGVLGEAFEELEDYFGDSRAPCLYLLGPSGVGKSSLINALANKEVAEVGDSRATTEYAEVYDIAFPGRYSEWKVIDSRGLFESVSPDGEVPMDTVALAKKDIQKYEPDIIIHVTTPDSIRAGANMIRSIEELRDDLGDSFPPILTCLNKVDTHAGPTIWPPDEVPSLAETISENLKFVAEVQDVSRHSPFEVGEPLSGLKFDSKDNVGVVPTCLKTNSHWNVDQISWVIGEHLPKSAQVQYFQAQKRDDLMRKLARRLTNRYSAMASGVGAAPTPVADVLPLLALQLTLVGAIGTLSCREFTWETVKEYMTAASGTTFTGLAARGLARSLTQLIPGAGAAVSGGVAGATTYTIGRSAEVFFFDNRTIEPAEFEEEEEIPSAD